MFKLYFIILFISTLWISLPAQITEQLIIPADNSSGDFFGQYITMQYPDILISAHQKNIFGYASGALYVYRASGEQAPFSEFQMIFPNDGDVEEFFGYSIDIDSDWAITGSHHDSDAGGSSGSAFILKKENSLWMIHQKIVAPDATPGDEFGKAVCMAGDEVFAGAWLDDDNGSNSGSVYIFERQNNIWVQAEKLYPDPAAAYDQFGNFMASDGTNLLVGVPENKANGPRSGCAFLFSKTSGNWEQTDRWIPFDGNEGAQFGQSVTISGDWAAVGSYKSDSYCTDCGAVYLYRKTGQQWAYFTTLIPDDIGTGDHFGSAVHLQNELLAIGAYFDDDLGFNSGSVYLYQFRNNDWQLLTKINASDGKEGDAFGSSVFLHFPWLIAGAYGKSQQGFFAGGAYIYNIRELMTTRVPQVAENVFHLYPVVFNDQLCIKPAPAENEPVQISLFSADGKLLFQQTASSAKSCIRPEDLPKGLILYQIRTDKRLSTGKLFRL